MQFPAVAMETAKNGRTIHQNRLSKAVLRYLRFMQSLDINVVFSIALCHCARSNCSIAALVQYVRNVRVVPIVQSVRIEKDHPGVIRFERIRPGRMIERLEQVEQFYHGMMIKSSGFKVLFCLISFPETTRS